MMKQQDEQGTAAGPSTRTVIPIQPIAVEGVTAEVVRDLDLDIGTSPTRGGWFSNYAKHEKVQPKWVNGRYQQLRWWAVWVTQIIYYGLPWLQWNGRQAVLFDLDARKFYLFDLVLWPQDFIYLAALLIIAALCLFFFTALAGRLWCGFACPQTVYTSIFMYIERFFEGDRNARMKLDAGPWTREKKFAKIGKHVSWGLLAFWTGSTFIGYFAPIRELGWALFTFQLGPWQWFWLLFYSFATWGNAGFMRDQVCKYMCPYARFQGAMFDRDTLIVTYDAQRGEPRGSRSRKAEPAKLGLGSCIECNLCVHVCPTGIDIRKGLQYECIGCAACVDVCNSVMDRMDYPRGLVRFSTDRAMTDNLNNRQTLSHVFRPRVLIYGAILLALCVGLGTSLALRNPLAVDVIRDRGALARSTEEGGIENTYRLQIMNTSERTMELEVSVSGMEGLVMHGETRFTVEPISNRLVGISLRLPPGDWKPGSSRIEFQIRSTSGPTHERDEAAVFIVPR